MTSVFSSILILSPTRHISPSLNAHVWQFILFPELSPRRGGQYPLICTASGLLRIVRTLNSACLSSWRWHATTTTKSELFIHPYCFCCVLWAICNHLLLHTIWRNCPFSIVRNFCYCCAPTNQYHTNNCNINQLIISVHNSPLLFTPSYVFWCWWLSNKLTSINHWWLALEISVVKFMELILLNLSRLWKH